MNKELKIEEESLLPIGISLFPSLLSFSEKSCVNNLHQKIEKMELKITKEGSSFFVGNVFASMYYKMNGIYVVPIIFWNGADPDDSMEHEIYTTELEAENRAFSLAAEFKKLLETERVK